MKRMAMDCKACGESQLQSKECRPLQGRPYSALLDVATNSTELPLAECLQEMSYKICKHQGGYEKDRMSCVFNVQ